MTPEQIAYLAKVRAGVNRTLPEITIPAGQTRDLSFAFQLPWEEGCWLISRGMSWPPSKQDLGYLPPGKYVVELQVGFEDNAGRPYSNWQQFTIFSPTLGQTIRMEQVKKRAWWQFWRSRRGEPCRRTYPS